MIISDTTMSDEDGIADLIKSEEEEKEGNSREAKVKVQWVMVIRGVS